MIGADLEVGAEVTVEVGPVAHGGHCVARHEGRVLFVRHALPGETVLARVTEGGAGDRFLRADCIRVVRASPDRVRPACPYAHPGGCGGCDFQHVSLDRQRLLKADVVREQFARLARLDLDAIGLMPLVEPVPGDVRGLGWRTRVEFAVSPNGRLGLRRHRSHDIVEIDRCPIAADGVNDLLARQDEWLGHGAAGVPNRQPETVDVVAPARGAPVAVRIGARGAVLGDGPAPTVHEEVGAGGARHGFEVSARGFWQVHPGAASTFVDAVLQALRPRVGERALDLYAGVGLFAVALADVVGPTGQVVAVESDPAAVESARVNLGDRRNVVVARARVDDAFGISRRTPRGSRRRTTRARARPAWLPERADLVVLDPPRTGLGRELCAAVAGLRPRATAYVACDPAALARDTASFAEHGYRLRGLRAFDAFPMTHHVECVAQFEPV